jgi:hypothetical protein
MCGWCERDWKKDPKTANLPLPPLKAPKRHWGLSDPMCEDALGRVRAIIPTCDPAYLEDYARIYTVLLDPPLIRKCLEKLDKAIGAGQATGKTAETNWLRLSSILSHFEKKCWFPEDILLPMGVLSNPDFYFYVRRGYVLKDYGAGVKHGEFTHRLQWHVLMRVITEDFTIPFGKGWDHSPLELYMSLGMPNNWGVWGVLLDRPGAGPTFNYPDSFHYWVLNSNLHNIVALCSKRETKRRKAFVQAIYDYLASRDGRLRIAKDFPSTVDPASSHDNFRAFEAWFTNNVLRATFKLPAHPEIGEMVVSNIYYKKLTAAIDDQYLKDKMTKTTKKRSSVYQKPQHAVGPVYSVSTRPICDEATADARAKMSRTELQKW